MTSPSLISTVGVFNPQSPNAAAIVDLFYLVGTICAVIMAIVCWLVIYPLVRYRHRPGQPDPTQLVGHKTIEIVWTVVPFLIVVWIFVLAARGMAKSDPGGKEQPHDLAIIGRQWWWEGDYGKFRVANEFHIPVGAKVLVKMDAADVIHCFWAPELSRKIDNVPGHPNWIWLQADHPGVYQGFCAEYCGTQHAWMHFQVVAQPLEEYNQWREAQAQPASDVTGRGAQLFKQMTCVSCHAVSGVADGARSGPDLTHFASRKKIGAGILENTPENVARWLKNPQAVKPGVLMANPGLTETQIAELTSWLTSLK